MSFTYDEGCYGLILHSSLRHMLGLAWSLASSRAYVLTSSAGPAVCYLPWNWLAWDEIPATISFVKLIPMLFGSANWLLFRFM